MNPGSYSFNGGVPLTSTSLVIALLLLVIAGAASALIPRPLGTRVALVIALIAVLYIVLNLALA